MAIDTTRLSGTFAFVLHSGLEIFPIKIRNQKTGKVAFRVSPGGKGGNTLDLTEQVDESEMIKRVLTDKYGVRCASLDGEVQGQYKMGHSAVKSVRQFVKSPF